MSSKAGNGGASESIAAKEIARALVNASLQPGDQFLQPRFNFCNKRDRKEYARYLEAGVAARADFVQAHGLNTNPSYQRYLAAQRKELDCESQPDHVSVRGIPVTVLGTGAFVTKKEAEIQRIKTNNTWAIVLVVLLAFGIVLYFVLNKVLLRSPSSSSQPPSSSS